MINKPMSKTTFGASIAGYRIVQTLEEMDPYKRKHVQKRISNFFISFCVGIGELYKIDNTKFVLRTSTLWLKDHIRILKSMTMCSAKMRGHVRDAIIAFERDFIREYSIEMEVGPPNRRIEMQEILIRHKRKFWDFVHAENEDG